MTTTHVIPGQGPAAKPRKPATVKAARKTIVAQPATVSRTVVTKPTIAPAQAAAVRPAPAMAATAGTFAVRSPVFDRLQHSSGGGVSRLSWIALPIGAAALVALIYAGVRSAPASAPAAPIAAVQPVAAMPAPQPVAATPVAPVAPPAPVTKPVTHLARATPIHRAVVSAPPAATAPAGPAMTAAPAATVSPPAATAPIVPPVVTPAPVETAPAPAAAIDAAPSADSAAPASTAQ